MIVAFGQNNIISVQHHHLHKHHCGSPSVENPHNVLAIAPNCFQMHKAFLISRNNSMTPAAQMSQTNRHDCVAAAGARLRQFSSTASYRGLLRREGEQRGDRKNCNHLNISLLKIPEGKLTVFYSYILLILILLYRQSLFSLCHLSHFLMMRFYKTLPSFFQELAEQCSRSMLSAIVETRWDGRDCSICIRELSNSKGKYKSHILWLYRTRIHKFECKMARTSELNFISPFCSCQSFYSSLPLRIVRYLLVNQ